MKKSLITNTHGFTSEALRKEERAISDAFFRQRVTAVRLILEGFSTVKAAEVLGICRQSVSTYVKMFNRGGIAELLQRNFPPGKQPYLSPEEQMEVKKVILESTPEQEGIEPSQSWDTRLLQKWIEERFSVTMSRSGIADMLHRLGLRWKRTTYVLEKANKEKQQAFVHQVEMIKKRNGRKYGTACTRRDPCSLVSSPSGYMVSAASFLEFLKKVMKRYANKKVIMIIDNAHIHHAKLLRPFLKEHHQRLYLLFLPPYSPNLNPIEKLWRWLKDSVISNVFHKNQSEIE